MKKYILGVLAITIFGSVATVFAKSYEAEFVYAVQWMNELGLTKYNNTQDFLPQDYLTREQAAKFFRVFKEKSIGNSDHIDEYNCDFSDVSSFDSSLSESISEACKMGLFKGVKGAFNPKDSLTKAQALTVLVRATTGVQDESGKPWRNKYFDVAKKEGFTKEKDVWALDRPVTRYEMGLLLLRASGEDLTRFKDNSTDAEIGEIQQLIEQFGGGLFE